MRAIVVLAGALAHTGCGGGGSSEAPTAPTPAPVVSIQSLRSTPDAVGIQFGTNFTFTASGSFPPGTSFNWQFGDATTLQTSNPTAGHVYARTGTFIVSLEAMLGTTRDTVSKVVTARSLVGRWRGTVTGHTRLRNVRGVDVGPALSSFEMAVSDIQAPPGGGTTAVLTGSWTDNVGCRVSSRPGSVTGLLQLFPTQGQIIQGQPWSPLGVAMVLPSYLCNGDAYDLDLYGTADQGIDRVDGSCAPRGCAAGTTCNCRFQMTRQ